MAADHGMRSAASTKAGRNADITIDSGNIRENVQRGLYDPKPMAATVVIVNGGDPVADWHRRVLSSVDGGLDGLTVIGVDSGVDRAHEAGLAPCIAVGDFDSVTAVGLVEAERSGARVVRHPTAKDRTDLELAVDLAIEQAPDRIIFVSMDGGRPDHALANLLLMSDPRLKPFEVDVLLAQARVAVVQDRRTLTGRVGDLVSLIPIGGSCFGVSTSGLQYPLADETVHPSHSRGVSNVMIAPVAVVELRTGTLLAFQPTSDHAVPAEAAARTLS